MIKTFEPYRRQGVAEGLYAKLLELEPDKKIKWGMLTEEGAKLKKKVESMKGDSTKEGDYEIYETIYEYASGADISHYRLDPSYRTEDCFAFSFSPVDDSDFYVDWDDEKLINGKKYVKVNWGETKKSYLPEDEVRQSVWGVYEKVREYKIGMGLETESEYSATGAVFENEEEAEKYIKEREKNPTSKSGNSIEPECREKVEHIKGAIDETDILFCRYNQKVTTGGVVESELMEPLDNAKSHISKAERENQISPEDSKQLQEKIDELIEIIKKGEPEGFTVLQINKFKNRLFDLTLEKYADCAISKK